MCSACRTGFLCGRVSRIVIIAYGNRVGLVPRAQLPSRLLYLFFFSSRRRHTRYIGDWSSDVCSSDLPPADAYFDLLLADRLGTTIVLHVGDESNVRAIMRHPAHTAGSDGLLVGARPRSEERRVGKERGCGARPQPDRRAILRSRERAT